MSKTYCYIRVSCEKQEYDRQIQILKDKGFIDGINCEFVEETFTGTKTKRPKFDEMIKKMEKATHWFVKAFPVCHVVELLKH